MARRKKSTDQDSSDPTIVAPVVDLFALLTPPGRRPVYEASEESGEVVCQETLPSEGDGMPETIEVQSVPELSSDSSAHESVGCESGDSLEKIRADGLLCTACELYKTRNHFVLGEGNPRARLILIGEAPGADEDASGRPFVGRAGQHLDKILVAAGFCREELYICNILKDRPPENRTPALSEMVACTPLLRRQLGVISPALIGLLGNTAVKYVIGPKAPGITQIHGQWLDSIFGIPCMPMYHPSYLLRNQSRERGSPNWQMWQDIQALKRRYDEVVAASSAS